MKTIIIAEAGVNHNGSIDLAKRLIDVASDSGADYVKFQTFKADNLVNANTDLADYQKENLNDSSSSQYEMLKQLELSFKDHISLKKYANSKT